jgi:hypothetical protein
VALGIKETSYLLHNAFIASGHIELAMRIRMLFSLFGLVKRRLDFILVALFLEAIGALLDRKQKICHSHPGCGETGPHSPGNVPNTNYSKNSRCFQARLYENIEAREGGTAQRMVMDDPAIGIVPVAIATHAASAIFDMLRLAAMILPAGCPMQRALRGHRGCPRLLV